MRGWLIDTLARMREESVWAFPTRGGGGCEGLLHEYTQCPLMRGTDECRKANTATPIKAQRCCPLTYAGDTTFLIGLRPLREESSTKHRS